jgi:uncharacterized protein (TIGR02231 family)
MNQEQEVRRLPAAIGAALIFTACGAAYSQETSKITSVTLYPGSATVERTARVTPGMTRIEISGLPANFDPQTLRVDAAPGVQIGEVSTQDIARATTSDTREAQLEEKIQALRDRQAALDGDIKSAGMVNEFLSRLGAPSAGGERPAPVPDAKSLAGVVDLIRRGSSDSLVRVQRAQVEKRELAKQIAALERDLSRLRSGAKDTRTVVVGVSAERAGTARIFYQVNGAGWRPSYRASLDSVASKIELLRQGIVQQTTGEDWSNVKLKLSTGQPRLSPQGPDPRPWLVSLFTPVARSISGMVAAEAPAALAMKREARADALAQTPIEVQTTFATEFEVPGVVSLPSDGRKVTVSLARLTLPAKLRLRVVPRLDPAAIVTAEAKRPEGVWLPGEIQLRRDGASVGSTRWNPQTSAELLLPFGCDDLVRVTFDRVKDRNGATGLIDRRNEREVSDVLTLTSFHKKPLELLVLESSPVSTSDRIDVRASFDPKPQVENWEERPGVLAWERTLAPQETLRIALNYAIAYPRDAAVAGLP